MLTGTVENQYEKNYVLQTARLFVDAGTESSLLVGSGFDMKLEASSANSAGGRATDIELAQSESKGKIIDLLQILHPTQIRLEAQIIEINSEDASDLGVKYGTEPNGSPGIFYFGEDYSRKAEGEGVHFRNNPFKWIGQNFSPINAQISALVEQGKAKILSRPSVITLSGEQATIQVGGEIPYTSTNANGNSNTEFKNFGIILQFRPIVDAQNRISSAIHAEVSDRSGETAGDNQPILVTRSADSVVTLYSGSSIVIGGLIDSNESKIVQKFPLLGDIPILGEFFRHTSKSKERRELIIVVTPYLVDMEDISQAPMSQPMRKWYEQEEEWREAMRMFDFNNTVAKETVVDDNNDSTNEPFE